MYLPRITLRALVTIGLTLLESIRTAMATPLEGEGSSLVAGEWTSAHPSLSARVPTLPCSARRLPTMLAEPRARKAKEDALIAICKSTKRMR
eukprot:scaffold21748_cov129-Isochrysis_galbana.AAC.6